MFIHKRFNCNRFQSQGYVEHFQDSCQDPISWIQTNTFFLEFAEGWALYAENPLIAKYTDTYVDDPLTKYGMLKWQVWFKWPLNNSVDISRIQTVRGGGG